MSSREDRIHGDARHVGAERIGAYLARQRELRGITIEELARATRIPVRSLQRLEGGAFDRDPDGFARGFVRTVAIALGLPADETIARMLPESDGADDGGAPRVLRHLAPALGLAMLLGAAAASLWIWLSSGAGPSVAPVFQAREDGLVVRRDAVRALAEEHGLPTGAAAGTFVPGAGMDPQPPATASDPMGSEAADAVPREPADDGAPRPGAGRSAPSGR